MSEDHNKGTITKRSFLQSIGMIGGSAAVYSAMQGLDLASASEMNEPPTLHTSGKCKKLIILGAGLSGMVTAIEMTKKGYDCQIIEARSTAGGRVKSARKGDVIHEIGGEKQVCNFNDNQYLNYGPWRIPAEHHATLHYCRALGVKLEPMINKSAQAYYYSEKSDGPLKGKRIRQVEMDVDRAGHVSELLAKCAVEGDLDKHLSAEDVERLIAYLRSTGLLGRKELNYRANLARGYREYPGVAFDDGALSEPYALSEMLKVKVGSLFHTADHPAVMFQPVGGMDSFSNAMFDALPRNIVRFNAEVTNILHDDEGVEITYTDTKTGKNRKIKGDYCISTIPFNVVSKIPSNFNPELINALKAPASAPAFKLGLQMSRRFWEQDEMIYGGSSYSDIPEHGETSYPSSDLHSNLGGVILGVYMWGPKAVTLSNMSNAERVEFGLSIGEKLHPGKYRKYYTGNSISMAWHKEKYNLAGCVMWSKRAKRKYLQTALNGEKRILFTGNGITPNHGGWMTGAIEGAWHTMKEIDKRAAQL